LVVVNLPLEEFIFNDGFFELLNQSWTEMGID